MNTPDAMTTDACLVEAEIAVLGGAMLEAEAADHALARLAAEDFHHLPHRRIFRAIESLRRQGAEPDALAVRAEMRLLGTFKEESDNTHLALIVETIPTAANQPYWTRLLLARREIAAQREVEREFDRLRAEGGFRAAAAWLANAHREGLPAPDRAGPVPPLLAAVGADR